VSFRFFENLSRFHFNEVDRISPKTPRSTLVRNYRGSELPARGPGRDPCETSKEFPSFDCVVRHETRFGWPHGRQLRDYSRLEIGQALSFPVLDL
jgi:hypothetical protein